MPSHHIQMKVSTVFEMLGAKRETKQLERMFDMSADKIREDCEELIRRGKVYLPNFLRVIDKAKESAKNSGQVVHNHFVDINEMVTLGSGATREIEDIKLSRYACYLIIQNSD